MSYIWGGKSPASGDAGRRPVDLRRLLDRWVSVSIAGARRVVPDLYRRIAQTLVFVAALSLIPAAGIAIGTVGSELASQAAAEERAAQYPVGDPTRCHRDALTTAAAPLPDLGIDWRWADLTSRQAFGMAILKARIVLLDPRMDCDQVAGTVWHEWTHIAQADWYGDAATTLDGHVVSDLVDDTTGRPFTVAVHEVVADCGAQLLADEFERPTDRGPYLKMLGGCPPEQLAMAREVIANAGVKLTAGASAALGSVGAGVA